MRNLNKMQVPFLDLKRQWQFFEKDFQKIFLEFGRKGHYVLGESVEAFEREFSKQYGYNSGVGVASGLAALEISLRAHNIGKGDEVITVANTAAATVLAILKVGATPIFCDVGEDFLIDISIIESLISNKTKAILPVHLFGKICNIKAIKKIANAHKLSIIEDACQAHGAKFRPDSSGNTLAFSFYPTKNLGALGEGGMILTNDPKVAEFAKSYSDYGQKGRYNHVIKGDNLRIDALQCEILNIKLQKLSEFNQKRRAIAKKYIEAFSGLTGIEALPFDANCVYHLFAVKIQEGKRDELKNFLRQRGIETLIHYPTPLHKQPFFISEYPSPSLPVTERLQNEILSLPCNEFLEGGEQDYAVDAIKDFLKITA